MFINYSRGHLLVMIEQPSRPRRLLNESVKEMLSHLLSTVEVSLINELALVIHVEKPDLQVVVVFTFLSTIFFRMLFRLKTTKSLSWMSTDFITKS